jgi:hypothetical protein
VRKLFCSSFLAALTVGLAACGFKDTFPADQVVDSLKKIVAKDYKMSIEARHTGDTLQVFFWRIGIVNGKEFELRPEAARDLEHVLLSATRVALSTDARLNFLEVKMADLLTGATITLCRYVPDIRDSMYSRIGEEEYINRLVLELEIASHHNLKKQVHEWSEPLSMHEFLAKQVVLRAKREIPIGVMAHEDLSEPSTLVVVIDNWPAIEEQGDEHGDQVAKTFEQVARTVVKGYRFNGFRGLVLQDGSGMPLKSWSF